MTNTSSYNKLPEDINRPEIIKLYQQAILDVPELIDNIMQQRKKRNDYSRYWKKKKKKVVDHERKRMAY